MRSAKQIRTKQSNRRFAASLDPKVREGLMQNKKEALGKRFLEELARNISSNMPFSLEYNNKGCVIRFRGRAYMIEKSWKEGQMKISRKAWNSEYVEFGIASKEELQSMITMQLLINNATTTKKV